MNTMIEKPLVDGNTARNPVMLSSITEIVQTRADRVLTDYVKLGLQCIPMLAHKKYPFYKWTHLQYPSWFLKWDQDEKTRRACEIAFEGQCNIGFITGEVSNNVLVIDCDDEETYTRFKEFFIKTVGRTRFTKSSRGGHILMRCPDAVLCNAKILDVNGKPIGDLLARNRLAVLPMSTKLLDNRTIFMYHDDLDSSPDIIDVNFNTLRDFVKSLAPRTTFRRYTSQYVKRGLSKRAKDFIEHGVAVGKRNDELLNATSEMLNHHTVDYVRQRMREVAEQHIPRENEKSLRTIESAIEKYIDRPQYRNKKLTAGDLALQAMPTIEFNGKAGTTQRAIYKALITRSNQEVGKPFFVATYRQIQTISGIRKNQSIRKALRHLCNLQVIQHVSDNNASASYPRKPSKWRWNIQVLQELIDTIPSVTSESGNREVGRKVHISQTTNNAGCYAYHLSHCDSEKGHYYQQCLSEPSALGRNGTTIYPYLLHQQVPCRVSTIAKALQLNDRTVRRNVNKLVEHLLVKRDGYDISATYNRKQVETVLQQTGAMETRRQHETRIQSERLWQAINNVCIGRIKADRSHHMNINNLYYKHRIESGEVVIEILPAPAKKAGK